MIINYNKTMSSKIITEYVKEKGITKIIMNYKKSLEKWDKKNCTHPEIIHQIIDRCYDRAQHIFFCTNCKKNMTIGDDFKCKNIIRKEYY